LRQSPHYLHSCGDGQMEASWPVLILVLYFRTKLSIHEFRNGILAPVRFSRASNPQCPKKMSIKKKKKSRNSTRNTMNLQKTLCEESAKRRLGSQNVGLETFGLQDCSLKAGESISASAACAAEVVVKMANVESRIVFTITPRCSSSYNTKAKKGRECCILLQ